MSWIIIFNEIFGNVAPSTLIDSFINTQSTLENDILFYFMFIDYKCVSIVYNVFKLWT
jgi:phage-related holin